jgi:uncharacterized membrane protein HdeD (DUF308 family)
MLKGRRIGTLTSGVALIVFGLMFLLHLFISTVTLKFIISLWPVILIFLGIEILLSYFFNKEEKLKYDAGAILLVVTLSLFAMCMACAQFVIYNWPRFSLN